MKEDPALQDVWEARRRLGERFQGNVAAYLEFLRGVQAGTSNPSVPAVPANGIGCPAPVGERGR